MADNVEITPGTGATVAADEIAGALYQRVKISVGADGTAVDLSAAAPMPISDASGSITVDGPLTDTELRADAVPVSLAALPALAAGTNNIGDVDVLTLPALAAGTNNIGDVDVASIAAGDNNIGNVDIASIAAGETLIGLVGASDIAVTVTPTCDTSAYASGDLLFDSTEVAAAVRANGGHCVLHSIAITDIDDQKTVFTLVFLNASTDMGTLNSAPDPDDTELLNIIGWVPVASSDWVDMGTGSVACIRGIGLGLKAGAATTSLWIAGVNGTGTPTHSASGLKLTLYFMRA